MRRLVWWLVCSVALGCEAGMPERVLSDPTLRDLGARDLGARDLGPRDLGPRDLGPRDLGPRDLGPRDLGPQDRGPQDLGPQDLGPQDQEPTDQEPTDQGPGEGLVAVGHRRELRGVWIATVYNINFPRPAALDPEGQVARLRALLAVAAEAGLNAVFFQVRPEGDAFWPSARAPWSRFLTGTQGVDPGYDPLAVLLAEARALGLEVHAWFNPFRAAVDPARALHPSHPAARFPEHAHRYRGQLWLDPGAAEVRADFVEGVRRLVAAYRVDGVHFDDYVYPYPDESPFPDDLTWGAYQASGGGLSRDDWRRENVLALMRDVHAAVEATDLDVMFGVSPFGIYRPGIPEGIRGLDQFASLYSDPPRWLEEGVVDYLAPQLYWNATRPQQDYETLLRWWAGLVSGGRFIAAGIYLSQLGQEAGWDGAEFERQVGLSRAVPGSAGNIFFQIEPLEVDRAGIRRAFAEGLFARPALAPPRPGRGGLPVAPPQVQADGRTVEHPDRAGLKALVVYRATAAGWEVERILSPDAERLPPGDGVRAVTAVRRGGAESLGAPVP